MTTPTAAAFWSEFNSRAPRLEFALRNREAELLCKLVDELAEFLLRCDQRLNLNIHGPDPFRIGILPLPGAEMIAKAFVEANNAPLGWIIHVGLPDDDLKLVCVQDESGNSLEIAYDDLVSTVLVAEDGGATVLLALDQDFDPTGPYAHLYRAAADNVVNTLLGGEPPELVRTVLLPLSTIDGTRLRPVRTLREQWLHVISGSTTEMP